MQKYSFSQDILIARITDILIIADKQNGKRGNFLKNIFVYFNEIVEIDINELRNIIASLPKNTKQEIMTTYQLIKKEGKIEGIQEGIEKGEVKKAEKVAKEMLKENEPINKIIKYTGLTEEEINNMKNE